MWALVQEIRAFETVRLIIRRVLMLFGISLLNFRSR